MVVFPTAGRPPTTTNTGWRSRAGSVTFQESQSHPADPNLQLALRCSGAGELIQSAISRQQVHGKLSHRGISKLDIARSNPRM
jgi:hypothetical protein